MKCNQIGANATEVWTADGVHVLFSYATPVAAFIQGEGWFRTSTKHSPTTSRHINAWVESQAREMPQSWFDSLTIVRPVGVPS